MLSSIFLSGLILLNTGCLVCEIRPLCGLASETFFEVSAFLPGCGTGICAAWPLELLCGLRLGTVVTANTITATINNDNNNHKINNKSIKSNNNIDNNCQQR